MIPIIIFVSAIIILMVGILIGFWLSNLSFQEKEDEYWTGYQERIKEMEEGKQ